MLRGGSSSQHDTSTPIHAAVPPILDGIITSPVESSSNFRPTLSHLTHHAFDLKSFFWADRLMVQRWFEVLMISLSTLLWGASADELGYPNPVQRPLGMNKLAQVGVLALRPRTSSVGCHGSVMDEARVAIFFSSCWSKSEDLRQRLG